MVVGLGAVVDLQVRFASAHGWLSRQPCCLVASVERLGRPVRIWGHHAGGHGLLYHLPGRVRLESTWEFVAGPDVWADLRALWLRTQPLIPHLERYDVDAVTVNIKYLGMVPDFRPLGWDIVHLDDRDIMLVRATDFHHLRRYRLINNWERPPHWPTAVTLENAHLVLQEAERAWHQCPERATFAAGWALAALERLGRRGSEIGG